jgi:RinA family phage transcriptional activator
LKRSKFNYIADIIREYPVIDGYIHNREVELTNKFQEFKDENVGGGRALNKRDESVADMAITMAEDKRLNNLRKNERAVRESLQESDPITQDIIYELYTRENCVYTLEGLAQKAHLSLAAVKKRRLRFFEKVAEKLGL